MATAVAAVVARVAPRAADRAAAARAVLALRRQGCSGSSGSSDGDGTSLSTASSTALTRVLARAFGGVDSGGVRAISENSTGPHTVDVGAPPDWAAPGLMRRRVRVGGCSEAWRELGVRLDTKPAPWLEDNGPWLVSGCRWSEGVFAHHPVRTTRRSVPVKSAHHCDTAPNGMYATLVWRQGAVCRARGTWARGSKGVPKLTEASLRPLTSRFLKLPLPQHAPTIAPRAPEHPRQTDAGTRFGRRSPLSNAVLHGFDVRVWVLP